MAINIKSMATEELIRELAHRAGESITDAVETAVRDRLDKLRAAETFEQYASPIRSVQQRIRERPVIDSRSADDIVGYAMDGSPSTTVLGATAHLPAPEAVFPKVHESAKAKATPRRVR